MSYWGSHYSLLAKENRDGDDDDDPERELRDDLSLSKEQLEEIRECFKIYDKSGKGYISPLELKSVLNSVGEERDDEEVREMILEICQDGSGKIGFIEFLHMMQRKIKQPITDEDMFKSFSVFDNDDMGYITIRGLEKVFLSLGQKHTDEELKEMIRFINTSGNEEGLCTFEEFKKYLLKENLVRKMLEDETRNNTEKSRSSGPYGVGSQMSLTKKSSSKLN
eukprot:gene20134-22107_t